MQGGHFKSILVGVEGPENQSHVPFFPKIYKAHAFHTLISSAIYLGWE